VRRDGWNTTLVERAFAKPIFAQGSGRGFTLPTPPRLFIVIPMTGRRGLYAAPLDPGEYGSVKRLPRTSSLCLRRQRVIAEPAFLLFPKIGTEPFRRRAIPCDQHVHP
jgi:hypothetical protein